MHNERKIDRKKGYILEILKKLDNIDLLILFYIQNIDGLGKLRMVKLLRDMYKAQCKFKNELCGKNEYIDIVEIGVTRIFEKPKKNFKNSVK